MTIAKYDASGLGKLVKGLHAPRSINITLAIASKEITGNVRKDYNVKAGALKEGLMITKATFSYIEGTLKDKLAELKKVLLNLSLPEGKKIIEGRNKE